MVGRVWHLRGPQKLVWGCLWLRWDWGGQRLEARWGSSLWKVLPGGLGLGLPSPAWCTAAAQTLGEGLHGGWGEGGGRGKEVLFRTSSLSVSTRDVGTPRTGPSPPSSGHWRCLSVLSGASCDSDNCLSLSAAHQLSVGWERLRPASASTRTQTPSSQGQARPPLGLPVLGVRGRRTKPPSSFTSLL